jgi:hypothetical protein
VVVDGGLEPERFFPACLAARAADAFARHRGIVELRRVHDDRGALGGRLAVSGAVAAVAEVVARRPATAQVSSPTGSLVGACRPTLPGEHDPGHHEQQHRDDAEGHRARRVFEHKRTLPDRRGRE